VQHALHELMSNANISFLFYSSINTLTTVVELFRILFRFLFFWKR
jgi:hypothetical protein